MIPMTISSRMSSPPPTPPIIGYMEEDLVEGSSEGWSKVPLGLIWSVLLRISSGNSCEVEVVVAIVVVVLVGNPQYALRLLQSRGSFGTLSESARNVTSTEQFRLRSPPASCHSLPSQYFQSFTKFGHACCSLPPYCHALLVPL